MRDAVSTKYLGMLSTSMIQGHQISTLDITGLKPLTRNMYAYYPGRRHSISQIKHIADYVKAHFVQSTNERPDLDDNRGRSV